MHFIIFLLLQTTAAHHHVSCTPMTLTVLTGVTSLGTILGVRCRNMDEEFYLKRGSTTETRWAQNETKVLLIMNECVSVHNHNLCCGLGWLG